MMCEMIALRRRDGTAEFDCIGCGVHVIQWRADDREPPLCALCAVHPGWQHDRQLRAVFGGGLRR